MSLGLEAIYSGKKALVTGHTGFKGSWLALWLRLLGADVVGYSLEPATEPNLFELARLKNETTSIYADVRDLDCLKKTIKEHKPDFIFHLAAQPIVLHSFENPVETFSINAIGTVNVLEACRGMDFLKGVVLITTDKCYDNREWVWGYRENDPLGGDDPYSASKAMAEIAAASYRASFFSKSIPVATARAGNVIGGGDFSDFRLIPDCMRALMNQETIQVRNPLSTRPWLHVLDPLYGYLVLGAKLSQEGQDYAEAWNFGPLERDAIPAKEMVEKAIGLWGSGKWIDVSRPQVKPEMHTLKLNWDRAAARLRWHPVFRWEESIAVTVEWFKAFEKYRHKPDSIDLKALCASQITDYTKRRKIGAVHEIYSNAS